MAAFFSARGAIEEGIVEAAKGDHRELILADVRLVGYVTEGHLST